MNDLLCKSFKELLKQCPINRFSALREIFVKFFDRSEINNWYLEVLKERAYWNDQQFYAYQECLVKGHKFHIQSCYQSAYDNGADVPVQCERCGMIDM